MSKPILLNLMLLLGSAAGCLLGYAGNTDRITGLWSGGVGIRDETRVDWNPIQIELREGRNGLEGILRNRHGESPVKGVLKGQVLNLEVSGKAGPANIHAEVVENAIRGTYQGRKGARSLLLIREIQPNWRAAADGFYRAPGKLGCTVRLTGERLLFTDYDTGLIRTLYAAAKDIFVAGPGFAVPFPIEWRLQFDKNDRGEVVSLAISKNGNLVKRLHKIERFPSEDFSFRSDGHLMAGTLTLPHGAGPHPAIVWVHGSGRQTRTGAGSWPLFLASRGFAVLAYDKRGVGESEGRYALPGGGHDNPPHMRRRAEDVRAAVAQLKQRPDIDRNRVGLVGGSQAGWVIPVAAAKGGMAFAVIISGGAVQLVYEAKFSRWAKEDVSRAASPSVASVIERLRTVKPKGYDFRPHFEAMTIPALWLYGDQDRSNPTQLCVEMIEDVRQKHGRDFTVKRYPRGNHGLLQCVLGGGSENATLSQVCDGVYAEIDAWLAAKGFTPR